MKSEIIEYQPNLGNHPERIKQEGVTVHYNERVVIGDTVEAISDVAGKIQKGTVLKITDLIIEPNGNERGFRKRLVFEGLSDDFNPQRFKKIVIN